MSIKRNRIFVVLSPIDSATQLVEIFFSFLTTERASMTQKLVYAFGGGRTTEEIPHIKNLLGGKGAGLIQMSNIGLPVPPGFTITTDVCTYYYAHNGEYPDGLIVDMAHALADIEQLLGCRFADAHNPLLLSARSGGRASMPGMMDTILNLGLNDVTVEGLAERTKNRRFAYDSYRRFIQMYGQVVLGVQHELFENILDDVKRDRKIKTDAELVHQELEHIASAFKQLVEFITTRPFPENPHDQLWGAISAVFGSWMNDRAITYRKLHGIPDSWGTAVTIQSMVFGNMGTDSATGVVFTRNPSYGVGFYGEYLQNAQGEDVVAGLRTPHPITIELKNKRGSNLPSMEESMPDAFAQLVSVAHRLEQHFHDMQDIEFTVQQGELFLLQTRTGKRSAHAAIKIAVDLVHEGIISEQEAVARIEPQWIDQLLHPMIDPAAPKIVIAQGLAASPGAVSGAVVFSADEAERLASPQNPIILARNATNPDDIHGMHAARGILTTRGGTTSHAAVVARGMGRVCVVGAHGLDIDYEKQTMTAHDGTVVHVGETVTIDGSTGEVMLGIVLTVPPEMSPDFELLMSWADSFRRMKVRANADTPKDAAEALKFGAEGIGLCRTEHMFFNKDRILAVREMILASEPEGRRSALAKILPMQRNDFIEIFRIMIGLPVTVRLLDPPLHEFLPTTEKEFLELSQAIGKNISITTIEHRAASLHETNPMLGHRGCRLGITCPEIYEMQVCAIIEAAIAVQNETGVVVHPEIMVPLVAGLEEFNIIKDLTLRTAQAVMHAAGTQICFDVGTMIELPRAALRAGDIAKEADFFSYGTNDLTQTTLGLSRDDSGLFLPEYVERGILPHDPFVSIDVSGVGELISIAAERGRTTRPHIKQGICGEHGGDPRSIHFCESIKLDYVSCSPFRVPLARLAAAQAVLQSTNEVINQ